MAGIRRSTSERSGNERRPCALIAIWGKQNASLLLPRFAPYHAHDCASEAGDSSLYICSICKNVPPPLLSPTGRAAEQVRTGHQHGHCSLGTALNWDPIFIVRVAFRSQRGWPVQSTIPYRQIFDSVPAEGRCLSIKLNL